MTDSTWIELTSRERTILLEALSSMRSAGRFARKEVDRLTIKLVHSEPHPKITVGVHGGQVQWTAGNPFPIQICDYDGEEGDLPDVDERGQRCRIWSEPADDSTSGSAGQIR